MSFKNIVEFLTGLAQNNNKEWMDANKPQYQAARAEFIEITKYLLDELAKFDDSITGLDPKKCIFRINRDIRFSKDKSPYKNNFGTFMVPGGKKSGLAGYYMHVQPGGESFFGGGIYMPPSDMLAKIRQEIDYNPDEFKNIINAPGFTKFFDEIKGEKLKTAPKGYPKDHPDIELLKHKSFAVWNQVSDKDLLQADILEQVIAGFKEMKPFNAYLNVAVS